MAELWLDVMPNTEHQQAIFKCLSSLRNCGITIQYVEFFRMSSLDKEICRVFLPSPRAKAEFFRLSLPYRIICRIFPYITHHTIRTQDSPNESSRNHPHHLATDSLLAQRSRPTPSPEPTGINLLLHPSPFPIASNITPIGADYETFPNNLKHRIHNAQQTIAWGQQAGQCAQG